MSQPQGTDISLREVTPENFEEVIKMKVRDDQKEFVATNLFSLAEARVFPGRHPMAIYAGETLVGFLMYVYLEDRQQHWIFRLMIGADHQGKGYGREAMRLLIQRMSALPGCRQIYISYEPHNIGAKTLYLSLGFYVTGEIIHGEEVACLDL